MAEKILVIGSLNMDLVTETPVLPAIGETVLGSGFMTAFGGKGANQAVAAARLGADATLVGCVGNDMFGKDIMAHLKKEHVNIEHIQILEEYPTGVATIVVNNGNNSIIVTSGANFRLTTEMIDRITPLIEESALLVMQFEIPQECVEHAIGIANRCHTQVLLNPAPARLLPDNLLGQVDILTPNEIECEHLTGFPVKDIESAKKAAANLLGKGVKQVIVTMGSNGAVYSDGSKILHKAGYPVKAIDTTAAGDSFTGALAVALSEGMDIHSAVDFGCKVGALTVMKMGAQTSLPSRAEVEKFIFPNVQKDS
jgi:ribokinase